MQVDNADFDRQHSQAAERGRAVLRDGLVEAPKRGAEGKGRVEAYRVEGPFDRPRRPQLGLGSDVGGGQDYNSKPEAGKPCVDWNGISAARDGLDGHRVWRDGATVGGPRQQKDGPPPAAASCILFVNVSGEIVNPKVFRQLNHERGSLDRFFTRGFPEGQGGR